MENSHLPVLKSIPEVAVLWIYDKNPLRSSLLQEMYNVLRIGEEEIDAYMNQIDICLLAIPYGSRKKYIELAASKNVAIYVEKPFALTIQEHESYSRLFPPHKLAIGFQRRYYQIVKTLQSVIQSEVFGELQTIKFAQGYFSLKGGGGYLSDVALAGGGVIVESAIHSLDLLLLVTEAKSVRLRELKSVSKEGIDYDSIFESEIETPKGKADVYCEISTLRNLENGVEFYFKNASLKCQLSCNATLSLFGRESRGFSIHEIGSNKNMESVSQSFFTFWTEFMDALSTEKHNRSLGNSSLITTSWIEQIYRKINRH